MTPHPLFYSSDYSNEVTCSTTLKARTLSSPAEARWATTAPLHLPQNLGALIATTLAKSGVNVVIHYNSASSKAETETTLKELESLGVKATAIQADLTTAAAVTS